MLSSSALCVIWVVSVGATPQWETTYYPKMGCDSAKILAELLNWKFDKKTNYFVVQPSDWQPKLKL
jgi:hypothetical protein